MTIVPLEASLKRDMAFMKLFLWAKMHSKHMKNTTNKKKTEKLIYLIWVMKETYDIKTTLLLIVCKASELCLVSHFALFFLIVM